MNQDWLKDRISRSALQKELSGDAISRQAAQAKIKAICEQYHLSYEDGERKVSTGGSAYALGHAFDDLPSVTEDNWIPVSKELPKEHICDDGYHEPSERVLVQTKGGVMYTSRYWSRNKDNVWTDLNYPEEIVAWQPLPERYKEPEISPEIFGRGI